MGAGSGEVIGVLYRGDAKTKYSQPNDPTVANYTSVNPYDFAVISQLSNRAEASQFMLQ